MIAINPKKYEHLFFDLEGTLSRPRAPLTKKMKARLERLPQTVVIVSKRSIGQMRSQVGSLECFLLGQNGNHAVFNDTELWCDTLNPDKVIEIMDHISEFKRPWEVPNENDLFENRGCQISYSAYGHRAPREEKEAFDPDQRKRKKMLKENPLVSDTIVAHIDGTTSIDYMRKGRHKGYNIERLICHMKWDPKTCIYIGDELKEGGNDHSVHGVVDTHAVKHPNDTFEFLKRFLP